MPHKITTPSGGLQFVVSNSLEKPDPDLRKFIRSHVMLGKNQGRTLPPRKRKPKTTAVRDKRIEGTGTRSANSNERANTKTDHATSQAVAWYSMQTESVPPKFGSALTGIRLADNLDMEDLNVILRLSSVAKHLLFALEPCILFVRRAETYIAPLALDPAYLHATIFTSHFYFDSLLPQSRTNVNQKSLPHLVKAVNILRQRFESDDVTLQLSDSTVATISALAGHAFWCGDIRTARYHIAGVYKLFGLRGGISSFADRIKLLVEVVRCDLGIALDSGFKPLFFVDSYVAYPDLEPLLALRGDGSEHIAIPITALLDIDNTLILIWQTLVDFCAVINFAIETKQRITTDTFFETMTSTMYRLLALSFETGSSDEAIRLALLVFSAGIFLHWKSIGKPYIHLAMQIRKCLETLDFASLPPQLRLWIFVVGTLSALDPVDDQWSRPSFAANLKICGIRTWREMRELLHSFMWIGLVYDKGGKAMFEAAQALNDRETELGSMWRLAPAADR